MPNDPAELVASSDIRAEILERRGRVENYRQAFLLTASSARKLRRGHANLLPIGI